VEIETATGRIDSLDAEIGKLKIQRVDLQSELAAVENKIAAAKAHNESDLSYKLTTPINGVIWRQHVVNGENLREGQVVADVADADHIYIEAFFRQEFMNSIAVGDKTTVQLIPGTSVLTGHVVDIQVQDSSTKSPSIINTSPIGAWMLRVIVEADSNRLGTDNIGKMAKVLISKPDANPAEKALLGLTLILKGH
jgi:multidrug resistance efflux pump